MNDIEKKEVIKSVMGNDRDVLSAVKDMFLGGNNNEYSTQIMFDRWISLLRQKAEYEHNARKNGEVVTSPDIDDICNEMIAYASGCMQNITNH